VKPKPSSLVHELGSIPILLGADEEKKQRWAPDLAAGEKLAAFGLTEPNAGSDVAAVKTKAVKDGDDYILTGTKNFISHGDVADLVCVA
jgi:alkylation response protein AidB-like acyl-CoA dehydrogenase